VIRVYDEAGNVMETHEHAGEFKEVVNHFFIESFIRIFDFNGNDLHYAVLVIECY